MKAKISEPPSTKYRMLEIETVTDIVDSHINRTYDWEISGQKAPRPSDHIFEESGRKKKEQTRLESLCA
jgi:hypothetical protein